MMSLAWSAAAAAVTEMSREAVSSSSSGVLSDMVRGYMVRLVVSWGICLSLVVRRVTLRSS